MVEFIYNLIEFIVLAIGTIVRSLIKAVSYIFKSIAAIFGTGKETMETKKGAKVWLGLITTANIIFVLIFITSFSSTTSDTVMIVRSVLLTLTVTILSGFVKEEKGTRTGIIIFSAIHILMSIFIVSSGKTAILFFWLAIETIIYASLIVALRAAYSKQFYLEFIWVIIIIFAISWLVAVFGSSGGYFYAVVQYVIVFSLSFYVPALEKKKVKAEEEKLRAQKLQEAEEQEKKLDELKEKLIEKRKVESSVAVIAKAKAETAKKAEEKRKKNEQLDKKLAKKIFMFDDYNGDYKKLIKEERTININTKITGSSKVNTFVKSNKQFLKTSKSLDFLI